MVFGCMFECFIPLIELQEAFDLLADPYSVQLLVADKGIGGLGSEALCTLCEHTPVPVSLNTATLIVFSAQELV